MASKVNTDERKMEFFLKALVETAALQLLWSRWADEDEVLTELLDNKLARRDKLLLELKEHFPDIANFDWVQTSH
jgi:hypothetical protein